MKCPICNEECTLDMLKCVNCRMYEEGSDGRSIFMYNDTRVTVLNHPELLSYTLIMFRQIYQFQKNRIIYTSFNGSGEERSYIVNLAAYHQIRQLCNDVPYSFVDISGQKDRGIGEVGISVNVKDEKNSIAFGMLITNLNKLFEKREGKR